MKVLPNCSSVSAVCSPSIERSGFKVQSQFWSRNIVFENLRVFLNQSPDLDMSCLFIVLQSPFRGVLGRQLIIVRLVIIINTKATIIANTITNIINTSIAITNIILVSALSISLSIIIPSERWLGANLISSARHLSFFYHLYIFYCFLFFAILFHHPSFTIFSLSPNQRRWILKWLLSVCMTSVTSEMLPLLHLRCYICYIWDVTSVTSDMSVWYSLQL